jgi:hypothetical protein
LTSAAEAALSITPAIAALKRRSTQRPLPLALFMLRVDANHPHHTFAVDDLAFVTDFLYRCSYFHKPAFSRQHSAFGKILGLQNHL